MGQRRDRGRWMMSDLAINLTINGEVRRVLASQNLTLLEILRDRLGLTGTKHGCDLGECGACTVLVDRVPVLSCLVLACDVEDRRVTTIEGLAEGITPDPLQTAFAEFGAAQCGYCTPAMVLTARALLDKQETPSVDDIREAIAGNLCRCTGYVKIVEAIQAVAAGDRA